MTNNARAVAHNNHQQSNWRCFPKLGVPYFRSLYNKHYGTLGSIYWGPLFFSEATMGRTIHSSYFRTSQVSKKCALSMVSPPDRRPLETPRGLCWGYMVILGLHRDNRKNGNYKDYRLKLPVDSSFKSFGHKLCLPTLIRQLISFFSGLQHANNMELQLKASFIHKAALCPRPVTDACVRRKAF